mgnify:FL=1
MIDPNTIDVDFQFDGLLEGFPTEDEMLRSEVAKPFPREWLIDRSEWRDRIEEHKKYKTFAEDYSGRKVHQGSSHECVSMSATLCFETTYNRQMSGLDHQVWFSPLSLYTRVTGGRRYGGSSVISTMWEMLSGDGGMIPEHDGPEGKNSQHEKFKHTVHQTSGRSEPWWPTKGWINPRELPNGWESIAEHFRVLECFTIPSEEAHISCLLGSPSCAISNGRSGHSISHQSVVYDNGRFYSRYQDSYGDRYGHDSLRMLGGGYCIRAVTMPHDPKNPAESTD